MTLQELVDKHGVDKVAATLGMKPLYIAKCIKHPQQYKVKAVKLVNAARKLN